ncbi:aminoglycoside phosphotransferase family protein [Actinokineospora sp.]|uniref:aminoglycoside phosphotransferase family protein n=1 Tax=Actinokineospora sp. TaxID=1872133 RepID=UPI0040377FAD
MTSNLEDTALHDAAQAIGLKTHGSHLLWQHATTVYLLPAEQAIARVSQGQAAKEAVERAVAVTRWLGTHGFPAVAPLDVNQPFHCDESSVTFWHYYPQGDRPVPEPFHLGDLLRELHRLPVPPIALPTYRPLTRFAITVGNSSALSADQRTWLLDAAETVVAAYSKLDFSLGVGLIHGDAYPGNLLWDGTRVVLGDWDEVAIGPREIDLVNTYQGARFGRTAEQLAEFGKAYRHDVTRWPGFPVLRHMRDLHTLGSYILRADRGNDDAVGQLRHRLATLRRGDTAALWKARQ